MFTPRGASPSRRFGSHLAISVTNACPLTCAHCISRSHPKGERAAGHLPYNFDLFLKGNSTSLLKPEKVSLTGGEPFYEFKLMQELLDISQKHNCAVTVITSAFWAKTRSNATQLLSKVASIGLLIISHDIHHEQFVSKDFVKNAYCASKELNIPVRIRLVQSDPPTNQEKLNEAEILRYANLNDVECQRLIKYGRALDNDLTGSTFNDPDRNYCPSSGPHIAIDGAVTPCCNAVTSISNDHPLKLGNVAKDSPEQIYESFRRSLLLAILKIEGAPSLRTILRSSRGNAVDNMSVCDLCFAVCSNKEDYNSVLAAKDNDAAKLALYGFGSSLLGMTELASLVEETVQSIRQTSLWVKT